MEDDAWDDIEKMVKEIDGEGGVLGPMASD